MTNIRAFRKDLEVQLSKVEEEILQVQIKIVRKIYDRIIFNSRILSGYYKSNHRIMVSGSNAKLEPSVRPKNVEALQFVDNIESTRQRELAKLTRVKKLGLSIRIGTAVPYALELEARDATYQRSVAEGQL